MAWGSTSSVQHNIVILLVCTPNGASYFLNSNGGFLYAAPGMLPTCLSDVVSFTLEPSCKVAMTREVDVYPLRHATSSCRID